MSNGSQLPVITPSCCTKAESHAEGSSRPGVRIWLLTAVLLAGWWMVAT
jgi:hypothetical protein